MRVRKREREKKEYKTRSGGGKIEKIKLSLMTTKKERKTTRKPPIQLTMDNNNSNIQK